MGHRPRPYYSLEITGVKQISPITIFELQQRRSGLKIILDCAGFLHNLELIGPAGKLYYLLSEDECWQVYDFVKEHNNKRKCVDFFQDRFFLYYCNSIVERIDTACEQDNYQHPANHGDLE